MFFNFANEKKCPQRKYMAEAKVLEGLKYTEKHEWLKMEGEVALIGITDYAQNALGDLVYIDLAKVGKVLKKGESCGTLESVKAAEDLYSPIGGEVLERNEQVIQNPALVNQDAYSNWMLKLHKLNLNDLENLLSESDYKKLLEGLS